MRFDQWQDSNGVPVASAANGVGKILQVVTGTTSTTVTVTATTFTDSGLSATITPTSATSKILVLVSQQLVVQLNAADVNIGRMQIVRDSTVVETFAGLGYMYSFAGGMLVGGNFFGQCLDSPNTTSAVTYKTQVRPETTASSGRVIAQVNSTQSRIVLMEVAE
jgi:hypothetical protein